MKLKLLKYILSFSLLSNSACFANNKYSFYQSLSPRSKMDKVSSVVLPTEKRELLSNIQKDIITYLLTEKYGSKGFSEDYYYKPNIHDYEKFHILVYAVKRFLSFPTTDENKKLQQILSKYGLTETELKDELVRPLVNTLVWKIVVSEDEKYIEECFLAGIDWSVKFDMNKIEIISSAKIKTKSGRKTETRVQNIDVIPVPLEIKNRADNVRNLLKKKLSPENYKKVEVGLVILESSGLNEDSWSSKESKLIEIIAPLPEESIVNFMSILSMFMERSYYSGGVMGAHLGDYYAESFLGAILDYFINLKSGAKPKKKEKKTERTLEEMMQDIDELFFSKKDSEDDKKNEKKISTGFLNPLIIDTALTLMQENDYKQRPHIDMDWNEGRSFNGLKWEALDNFILSQNIPGFLDNKCDSSV